MTEYDILCSILNKRFSSIPQNVMIEEKGELEPQRVAIDGTGRKNLLWTLYRFSMDDFNFLPFFAKHPDKVPEGLCKFCDYILIVETKLNTFVLLIELKRGQTGGNAEKQLHASEIFMKYIFATASRLHQDFQSDLFNANEIVIRKIKLKKKASSKITTKMQNIDLNQNYIQYDSVGSFPIAKFC